VRADQVGIVCDPRFDPHTAICQTGSGE